MKVWKDIFTGDAMVSTDFRSKEIYGGAGLEVICKILEPVYITTNSNVSGDATFRKAED